MTSSPPASESETADRPYQIVFMGTPPLAAHILARLIENARPLFTVAGVVTRPDTPRGRGMKLEPSAVGALAARHGLAVLKPAKIRTAAFLAELKGFNPDLLVVAAYGRILPTAILEAARIMALNVHASLLPRHRGAAPIEGAILAGDAASGVTIIRITEQMDAGPILLQRVTPLGPQETQATLKDKLAELGAQTLLEALALLRRGELRETPQDDSQATYTSPVKKEDALIDWNADAASIERMTRAYDPWPVARTRLDKQEVLVWRARVVAVEDPAGGPGTLVTVAPQPIVQCGRGRLALLVVQAAGRKRMSGADFMRGRRVAVGAQLG